VKGGDASALAPVLIELVAQGGEQSEGVVAGKPVSIVTTPDGTTTYAFASGEILWLVEAQEPALSEIIAALP
jgi:hypothetical protein